jgi:hypothetical protein
VTFFERDLPYYAPHRDLFDVPGGELRLYRDWNDVLPQARKVLDECDVAMVTSYCPDGVAALPQRPVVPRNVRGESPAGARGFVPHPRASPAKPREPKSDWIWGAFKLDGRILCELHELWIERSRRDEYLGTLVNAWLARGGRAQGVRAGEAYVDVGTLHGYRHAIQLLASRSAPVPPHLHAVH